MTTRTLPHAVREMLLFGAVYFFVALIQLRTKLVATPTWFDGTLERNHALLRAFQHTNNEQSRLLQFYIPEALHRVAGLSIAHAYLLQHWAFVLATLLCFHAYLRRWFTPGAAFAGVMTLAAILPLTYMDDLQESAPLLMLTFLLALWAIRERHAGWYTFTLAAGALNNETMLVLPAAYFFCNFMGGISPVGEGWRSGQGGQVRLDGVGPAVAGGDVPVDRPGHRAADAGIGARRAERAAVGAAGQAVEGLVDH